MKFKKVDILISENLTREELKNKILTELNKIANQTNPRIHYVANIHDLINGKYWICMDSETKLELNAPDELIDLQAIFRHTVNEPSQASDDKLYSSKYIEDNFLRSLTYMNYVESNDSRIQILENIVDNNERDIELKMSGALERIQNLENYVEIDLDEFFNNYNNFKDTIQNNINALNTQLGEKAQYNGNESQPFRVGMPVQPFDSVNLKYLSDVLNITELTNHIENLNNPHETTISNLVDTNIVSLSNGQFLMYDGTKWINSNLPSFGDNFYDKTYINSNFYTRPQTDDLLNSKTNKTDFENLKNKPIVEFKNITDLSSDVETLKSNVTLQNVFNQWSRFAVKPGVQNDAAGLAESSKWTYIESEDCIASNINSVYHIGFINPSKVDNFEVTLSATGQDGDDDMLGIVLSSYYDINNKLHTLTLVRRMDNSTTSFCLYLDYLQENSYILANKSSAFPGPNVERWNQGWTLLKAKRSGTNIKGWTSKVNQQIDESQVIDYTLPQTKPSGMSDEQYNHLKYLLSNYTSMGFSNASQNIKFKIQSQTNVYDDTIIDIEGNKLWRYSAENRVWASEAFDISTLPTNVLISNKYLLKIFYYDGTNVTRIS